MNRTTLRRTATALGSIGMVTAIGCALAASASAVPSLTDNGDGTVTASGVSSFGNDGLWICTTATAAASCVYPGNAYDYGTLVSGTYQVGSNVFTPTSPGYVPLPAGLYNMNLVNGSGSITLTNVRIGAAPAPAPAENGPASVLQAFAAPSGTTCDAVADPSLNWGGVASGGWSASWQEWANGGSGGSVCQRTLAYDTSSGQWVVAS